MDEKSKILIVEDNLRSRKTLSDILKAKGFSTITADSGREALDRLKEAIPAVALIDLKLEDMSGLEVMKGTKKRFPGTECIIITGYASKASAIEAVNMGAYAYVEKPYDMEQLLAMIRRAVEKREVEETLKDSEARYKTLFEGASQGILIVDVETKNFQYANAALCKMLGYTDEELKRMSVSDIHPEEELEHVVSEFESQTRGEKSLSADKMQLFLGL
jgi:DNA-binding NtrC family response regulator